MKRRTRIQLLLLLLAVTLVAASSFFFQKRYVTTLRQGRELTLKHDLLKMREAIDNYTPNTQQAPQALQDLVDSHYIREIPTDPFTEKRDWAVVFDDVVLSPDQKSTGIVDVHSSSSKLGSDSVPYSTW
jgi:general secretion pathway protein G